MEDLTEDQRNRLGADDLEWIGSTTPERRDKSLFLAKLLDVLTTPNTLHGWSTYPAPMRLLTLPSWTSSRKPGAGQVVLTSRGREIHHE